MKFDAVKHRIQPLASLNLFFWLCGLLGASMLLGTLNSGWNIYHSFWFIGLLGVLAVNTVACVALRWKSVPWPSLVSHFGILCILAGGAVSLGLAKGGQISLSVDGPAVTQVRGEDGSVKLRLPFQVKLKKFDVDYYGVGKHELLLTSVKDGEQETLFVEPGMRYTAKDGSSQVEVLEFNPDFYIDGSTMRPSRRSNLPRNPALLIRLSASPKKKIWVFQDFPGMHQEGLPVQAAYAYHAPAVKQYKSTVELRDESGKALSESQLWVNKPLKWDGYTLYQSGYDPEDPSVSVISVRRDPGGPLVYLGFLVLVLGLAWNALRRMA